MRSDRRSTEEYITFQYFARAVLIDDALDGHLRVAVASVIHDTKRAPADGLFIGRQVAPCNRVGPPMRKTCRRGGGGQPRPRDAMPSPPKKNHAEGGETVAWTCNADATAQQGWGSAPCFLR